MRRSVRGSAAPDEGLATPYEVPKASLSAPSLRLHTLGSTGEDSELRQPWLPSAGPRATHGRIG